MTSPAEHPPGGVSLALNPGLSGGNGVSLSLQLTAEERELLGRFVSEHQRALIARARRCMDRYRIDELQIVAEGTVHGALLKLCRAQVANPARSIETLEGALAAFPLGLQQFIRDEARRQRRIKRGGPGVRRADVDLDLIPSEMAPPELPVFVADEVERWHGLLDRRDPSLRTIAALKQRGFTNQKIARRLHMSLSSLERKLREIRSLWMEVDPT